MFKQTHDQLLNKTIRDFLCDSQQKILTIDSPPKPRQVIKVTTQSTVAEVLKEFATYNLLSSPVIDSTSSDYCGLIDVADLLKGFLDRLSANYSELNQEEFLQHHHKITMAELQSLGLTYSSTKIHHLLHNAEMWYRGDVKSTVLSLIKDGFRVQNNTTTIPSPTSPPPSSKLDHVSRVHHRIAVFDVVPGEQTADGPIPEWRVQDIISQMDILRYFVTHAIIKGGEEEEGRDNDVDDDDDDVDEGWKRSVGEWKDYLPSMAKGRVCQVHCDVPTLTAFSMMQQQGLSGLAVVDPATGKLCGNLSVSDLRGITADRYGALALPVAVFLLFTHPSLSTSTGLDWENVLLGKYPTEAEGLGSWLVEKKGVPLVACREGTPLKDVVVMMVEERKHRVYVVNDEGVAVGVITPTDILKLVLEN